MVYWIQTVSGTRNWGGEAYAGTLPYATTGVIMLNLDSSWNPGLKEFSSEQIVYQYMTHYTQCKCVVLSPVQCVTCGDIYEKKKDCNISISNHCHYAYVWDLRLPNENLNYEGKNNYFSAFPASHLNSGNDPWNMNPNKWPIISFLLVLKAKLILL